MTTDKIFTVKESLKSGSGVIKHWYSPHGLTGGQKSLLKRLGISFEQRYRSKRWFELDFSLK
jgi:hypothetical protein